MKPPYVITRKGQAATTAERWAKQYRIGLPAPRRRLGDAPMPPPAPDKVETHRQLIGLGANPDPTDVDKAIGNTTWTEVRCDQCRDFFEEAVVVGQPRDYDSGTATLCRDCLQQALGMLAE